MNFSKKKIVFLSIFVFLIGMFLLKNFFFIYLIESKVKKNGGEIRIDSFNVDLFSSSFIFKGLIEQSGKKITLQNVIGHYYLSSIFEDQKHLAILNITGGNVALDEKYSFEKFRQMPLIDNLEVVDFSIDGPQKNLEKSSGKIIKIENLKANQWHKSNGLIRFSNLNATFIWNDISFIANSVDGQVVVIRANEFPIERIYKYLPSYFSIVKKATIGVEMKFEYPSQIKEGRIHIKIKCRDFLIKEQHELSFLEIISLPIINSMVSNLKNNGAESVIFFSEKDLENDPMRIFIESYQKTLREVLKFP